jgi:predicted Holliday junction resolvase-like endonuclease
MIGSIIFLMVLGLVIFKMVYDHQIVKEREFGLRLSNRKLGESWNEAHNERNDGWTKMHYLNLYNETKEFGQEEKEGVEERVSRKSSTRKPRGKNAGE